MRQYDKFLKQKNKALGVFSKARAQLTELKQALLTEHDDCQTAINKANEAQKFLQLELAHVSNTLTNIQSIIGE